MQILRLSLFGILTFSAILLSGCESRQESLAPTNEQGSIASLEKNLRVAFHKKDLVIKDRAGENQIVLRVAGGSESQLSDYLSSNSLILTPLYKQDVQQICQTLAANQSRDSVQSGTDIGTGSVLDDMHSADFISGIHTEVISKSLAEGVVGYTIQIKQSETSNSQARKSGYPYEDWHHSGSWEECGRVKWKSVSQTSNQLDVTWYTKWRWWDPAGWLQKRHDTNVNSTKPESIFSFDTYRIACNVESNHRNYELSFWNCK